jgi:hypothetical protein
MYHGTTLSAVIDILHREILRENTSLSHNYEIASFFAAKGLSEKLYDIYAHGWKDNSISQLEYEADLGTAGLIAFDQAKVRAAVGLQKFVFDPTVDDDEEEEQTQSELKPVTPFILWIEADNLEAFAPLVLDHFPEYAGAINKLKTLLR